jgi:hypothetical protein
MENGDDVDTEQLPKKKELSTLVKIHCCGFWGDDFYYRVTPLIHRTAKRQWAVVGFGHGCK